MPLKQEITTGINSETEVSAYGLRFGKRFSLMPGFNFDLGLHGGKEKVLIKLIDQLTLRFDQEDTIIGFGMAFSYIHNGRMQLGYFWEMEKGLHEFDTIGTLDANKQLMGIYVSLTYGGLGRKL